MENKESRKCEITKRTVKCNEFVKLVNKTEVVIFDNRNNCYSDKKYPISMGLKVDGVLEIFRGLSYIEIRCLYYAVLGTFLLRKACKHNEPSKYDCIEDTNISNDFEFQMKMMKTAAIDFHNIDKNMILNNNKQIDIDMITDVIINKINEIQDRESKMTCNAISRYGDVHKGE